MIKKQRWYSKGSNQIKKKEPFLNYFFGLGNKSSRNIVGLISFILLIGILGIAFFGGDDKVEILEKLIPVFIFLLGYFIGTRNQ